MAVVLVNLLSGKMRAVLVEARRRWRDWRPVRRLWERSSELAVPSGGLSCQGRGEPESLGRQVTGTWYLEERGN